MRSEERLIQERLLADSELQEFDIVDKIGKGIGRVAGSAAKAAGAVAGGVAGLGQAAKAGYQAGKATTSAGGADPAAGTAKPAAGSTPATPAPKPAAGGTAAPQVKATGGGTSGIGQGISAAGKGKGEYQGLSPAIAKAKEIGGKTVGKAADYAGDVAKGAGGILAKGLQAVGALGDVAQKAREYDPAAGTKVQRDAEAAGKSVGQYQRDRFGKWMAAGDTDAKDAPAGTAQPAAGTAQPAAQQAPGAAKPAATSTGGGAPGATQVPGQKPAAGAAPGSIVKSASGKDVIAGVDGKPTAIPANSPGAKKAIADIQAKAKAQGTTTTLINTPKGQDPEAAPTDQGGPSDTAQGVGDKTGVTPPGSQAKPGAKPDIKIGGQKIKSTDPLYDKLVASIPAETRAQIDGLSDYDKGRLKKELAA